MNISRARSHSKRHSPTQPHNAGVNVQLTSSSVEFDEAKYPTLNYSKVTHETTSHTEQDTLMSTDISTAETWSAQGGYAKTVYVCRCARIQPSTTVAKMTVSLPIQHILGLETVEYTRTAPYSETLRVHAGSYGDLGTETPIPSPTTTEHDVESDQLAALEESNICKDCYLGREAGAGQVYMGCMLVDCCHTVRSNKPILNCL